MPIYVYPQGPSAPISRLKRVDEQASANEATKLDVQQEVAIIGETIPLIFGKRVTYENSNGDEVTHGGCWTTPRLIALGLTNGKFSLMYVLTQGRLVNLPIADVKYGNTKLEEIDGNSLCLGYQQIPDCVDIEYTPGGSLGWESTIISSGPSLSASQSEDQLATWTSANNKCIGFSMQFNSTITVSASEVYIDEQTYRVSSGEYAGQTFTLCPSITVPESNGPVSSVSPPYQVQNPTQAMYNLNQTSNGRIPRASSYDARVCFEQIAWTAYSYRTWSYRVIDLASESVVKAGTVKVGGNQQLSSLTVDNLPASQYRVEFYATTALRSGGPSRYSARWANGTYGVINISNSIYQFVHDAIRHNNNIVASYNNALVENVAGTESVSVSIPTVIERIYDELEFPDAPGSGEVITAGYRNLTLVGITGTTAGLRPVAGPDYFLQLHCFCREGIYVKQQLQNYELGPSNVYSDLVLHLLEQGGMLKTEQIDYQALLYAARFCEQYKLHFNGVLSTTNSGAEWLTRTAPYFLCAPRQVDGKYGLTPVVPIDAQYKISEAAVTPVMTLTTDDIVQDSYNRQYINVRDRRPVCLVMLFREQSETGPGQPRTIEVRYPGTAQDGPFETHDMTEFCVSATHAAYAARYILAKKRYVEHTVELAIGRRGNMLRPGDIVQIDLALDTTDGAGITDSTFYEIEQIGEGIGGAVNLTLIHFPVDGSGVSLIAKDIAAGEVEIS